jgi:hypothetical protein
MTEQEISEILQQNFQVKTIDELWDRVMSLPYEPQRKLVNKIVRIQGLRLPFILMMGKWMMKKNDR